MCRPEGFKFNLGLEKKKEKRGNESDTYNMASQVM